MEIWCQSASSRPRMRAWFVVEDRAPPVEEMLPLFSGKAWRTPSR